MENHKQLRTSYVSGYHKSLDGLRGMAVLMVWFYHYTKYGPFVWLSGIGWSGADLFFVLSGFLITGILLDNKKEKRVYQTFVARRALRIFPLYWIVLGFSLLAFIVFSIDDFANLSRDQVYFWTYTQNFIIAQNGWVYRQHNHFWTLAIEEQFYLFWPLVILFFKEKTVVKIALLLIVVGLILRNVYPYIPFAYTFTLCRLDGLLLGSMIAIWIRKPQGIPLKIISPALYLSFIIITAMVLIYFDNGFSDPGFIRFGYTIIAIFFGALVSFCFVNNRTGWRLNKFFEAKPLVWLGKYSYGIYVYHYIIYNLLDSEIVKALGMNNFMGKLISTIICSLLTLAISYVSYQFLESKFLKLKRWMPYNKVSLKPDAVLVSSDNSAPPRS